MSMRARSDLAKLIAQQGSRELLELQVGEVLSFTQGSSSVPTTADVDLEGAAIATVCLSLDSYTLGTPAPAAGDIVLVLTNGQDNYILGRIS